MLLPDYAVVERDGRVLVGRDPLVQQRNATAYASVVMLGGPTLVGLVWWRTPLPGAVAAVLAALSAAAGFWMLRRAVDREYPIDERNSLMADPRADRMVLNGRPLCAASEVAAVDLRPSPDSESALSELVLVTKEVLSAAQRPIVTLEGLASHLEEPGRRLAECLGVPFRRR